MGRILYTVEGVEERECRPSVPGPDLEMPSWVPEMNGRPLRAGWSWREEWGLREG